MKKIIFWAMSCLSLALGFFEWMGCQKEKAVSIHEPNFRWITGAGGKKFIYDGTKRIAALNEAPQLISFNEVTLNPEGLVFIDWIEAMAPLWIAWSKNARFNMAIEQLSVDDSDPKNLKLYFKMRDTGLVDANNPESKNWESAFLEETWLEVTFDSSHQSYVFDIRSRLKIREGREKSMEMLLGKLEYQDILPTGIFLKPRSPVPDDYGPHLLWIVYTASDGKLYKLPMNHAEGPQNVIPRFAENGMLMYFSIAKDSPVIEFLDGTGGMTQGEVCFWAGDIHLNMEKDGGNWNNEFKEIHYKIYSKPQPLAKPIFEKASLLPVFQEKGVPIPPYVVGETNKFEPSDKYMMPGFDWFWKASDIHGEWNLEEGYDGPGCLTINRPSGTGKSFWVYRYFGKSYPPNPLLNGCFRVHAKVKTQDVSGRVRMGWKHNTSFDRNDDPDRPSISYEYSKTELSGTNDWTELTLETSDTTGNIFSSLYLIQEGSGRSWFDDVRVEPGEPENCARKE